MGRDLDLGHHWYKIKATIEVREEIPKHWVLAEVGEAKAASDLLRVSIYIYILKVMGFEIIGAQAQDTSPNIGIKNGSSTSNRPLMVSLKGKPKTRAQFTPLKG